VLDCYDRVGLPLMQRAAWTTDRVLTEADKLSGRAEGAAFASIVVTDKVDRESCRRFMQSRAASAIGWDGPIRKSRPPAGPGAADGSRDIRYREVASRAIVTRTAISTSSPRARSFASHPPSHSRLVGSDTKQTRAYGGRAILPTSLNCNTGIHAADGVSAHVVAVP